MDSVHETLFKLRERACCVETLLLEQLPQCRNDTLIRFPAARFTRRLAVVVLGR